MSRFLVSPEDLKENQFILKGPEAHHATHVLRKQIGDTLSLFDGRDRSFSGVIRSISEKEVTGEILSEETSLPISVSITLCQGLIRGPKWDWIVEKAAEIGVSRLVPLLTARSVVKWNQEEGGDKLERWRRIALAASKQCGRSDLMVIDEPRTLTETWPLLPKGAFGLIPWEKQMGCTIKEGLREQACKSIWLFVGPEGGWENREVEDALSRGITAVRLGPTLLRSETAGLVAATLAFASQGVY